MTEKSPSEQALEKIEVDLTPPDRRLPRAIKINLQEKIKGLEEKRDLPSVTVHWYDRALAWANGKKLWAGAGFMVAGGVLSMIPGTQAAGFAMIGKGVFTAGSILAGTGLIHKILKQSSIGAKGEFGNKELIELVIKILLLIIELINKYTKKK